MVALTQILIYLFCLYLVYKGLEIFQIAYVSTAERHERTNGLLLGVALVGLALGVGLYVYDRTERIAAAIGSNIPKLP